MVTAVRGGGRRGGGGPPRRPDDRTGAGPGFARAVALALPEVETGEENGEETFSAGGREFLRLEPGEWAVVQVSSENAESRALARPKVFVVGDGLRLLLKEVGRDEVRGLIDAAWRRVAPAGAVAMVEAARRAEEGKRRLTIEDIRAVVLALPEVTEIRELWTRRFEPAMRHEWQVQAAQFARHGPKIGNLLPPDDEDTLLIRHCPQRPALLAARADRFFMTPHYGDPETPGWIMTRLCEHTVDDLPELTEMLTASYEWTREWAMTKRKRR